MTSNSSKNPLRAICIENHPLNLPDHQQDRAARFSSEYPLTKGKRYTIFGMILVENILWFLVQDDYDGPNFAPAAMFDLASGRLPEEWEFGLGSGIRLSSEELGADTEIAVWGYSEMVNDPDHMSNLSEREDEAMMIFIARVLEARAALDPEDHE